MVFKLMSPMRRSLFLLTMLVFVGCAKVLAVRKIPEVTLGDAAFFRTIQAHTGAPIVGGNRVEVLLNGDETFPRMLRDIKSAKSTITFAQYLYEDGSIAHELAQAFAERCRRSSTPGAGGGGTGCGDSG